MRCRGGLGPAMIPLHRDADWMDDIGLHAAPLQPARQPETVTTGFNATAIRAIG